MKDIIGYSSYTFEMDKIPIKRDIVVSMGSETVVPFAGNPNGRKTLKRLYTHIWEKENGRRKLIAKAC